jgi:hypothetical protein
MPGARHETKVPKSADTITIAASETMLAKFALTLFLEPGGALTPKLSLKLWNQSQS